MKQRTRINYTPEQEAIIWDRYKQGESLHDIATMFGRDHPSVNKVVKNIRWFIKMANPRSREYL